MTQQIQKLLDDLSDVKLQAGILQAEKKALIDRVITPEIKAQLDEIEAEFKQQENGIAINIQDLENMIKELVIENGASVKGNFIHAVYSDGRTSWNSKKLYGLIKELPKIAECIETGKPSVALRNIKE